VTYEPLDGLEVSRRSHDGVGGGVHTEGNSVIPSGREWGGGVRRGGGGRRRGAVQPSAVNILAANKIFGLQGLLHSCHGRSRHNSDITGDIGDGAVD